MNLIRGIDIAAWRWIWFEMVISCSLLFVLVWKIICENLLLNCVRNLFVAKLWSLSKPWMKPKAYTDPKLLWHDCVDYFKWCEDNPLIEEKVFCSQGEVTRVKVKKMRAMTYQGLAVHLGVGVRTWQEWRNRPDLKDVVNQVESVIYEQKFTGAAAEQLNAAIIKAELGLADKQEHSSPDGTMTPTVIRRTVVDPSKDDDE